MELSPRKQAVLAAVTKAYIKTGDPVGSKALTALLKNAPSAATLRNEMSELCDMGLLAQPHTSAGRIPTSSGFKLYVNSLMTPEKLSDGMKRQIDSSLDGLHCAPEKIPEAAGKLLSDLTGLPAVVCFETDGSPKIKSAELFPVSRGSVMLLIVTADGRTRHTVLRLGTECTKSFLEKSRDIISRRINGRRTDELTRGYMQSVAAEAGADAFALMPLFSSVLESAAGIESSGAYLLGEQRLYGICESKAAAKRILSLVALREPMITLTKRFDGNIGTVFGRDSGFRELENNTMIAAKYYGSDRFKGTLCVIGPNRMSYGQIIPSVEYTALRLTEIMTEAQKDMED